MNNHHPPGAGLCQFSELSNRGTSPYTGFHSDRVVNNSWQSDWGSFWGVESKTDGWAREPEVTVRLRGLEGDGNSAFYAHVEVSCGG